MSSKDLPDQIARDKIKNLLDRNLLVEAGAGSGKTTGLVQRMAALVQSGKYRVGEITAITFTRKAAAELKERFHGELVKRQTGGEHDLLKLALEQLDQCFIGTVHSFCARLLRERPVEAGIDPDFREIDERQQEIRQAEVWDNYLLAVKRKQPQLLKRLDQLGINVLDLQEDFATLSLYPDVEVMTEQADKPLLDSALEQLLKFCREAANYIPTDEPAEGYDSLQLKVLSALRLSKYLDLAQDANIVRILTRFSGKSRVVLKRWLDREQAVSYRDNRLDQLQDEIIEPVLRQWREYCHYLLATFLKPAVSYYRKLRQQESSLNFQDLLLSTVEMLRDNPEVRQYFRNKYRSLLVDEFQDTDPLQAALLFYLTGREVEESDWTALTPQAGSLFVVGDPKQAIYRFRRADLASYNLVKKLLLEKGGEVLELTANFRSFQALGEYLNPVLQAILPARGDPYQAGYVPLNTVSANQAETTQGVRVLKITAENRKKEELVKQDASAIARLISAAVNGGIRLGRSKEQLASGLTTKPIYRDFMIILRYKEAIGTYARILREYGIPVKLSGGDTLKQASEFRELHNLLTFLADPANPVLLVAVLRGLFFGLSDNQLYHFKQQGGNFNIFAKLPAQLKQEMGERFKQVFNKLVAYHHWTLTLPPTVLLERLIAELGLLPYLSTQSMGRSRCSQLYYLLEGVRRAETGGVTTFAGMLKELEQLLTTGPATELSLTPEEDSVRLLNLHQAKGLEAPVVFLAHPGKRVRSRPTCHIKRNGKQTEGYFSFTRTKGWSKEILGQPVNWEQCRAEEQRHQKAEEIRLLYVAATRARNLLIISSYGNQGKNPWRELLNEPLEEVLLKLPDGVKDDPGPGEIKQVNPAEFRQKRKEYQNWVQKLAVPSYTCLAPTDLKDETAFFRLKRSKGGGKAWGTAVHLVLEQLVAHRAGPDLLIRRILKEHRLAPEREEEMLALVARFQESELWPRIKQAAEVQTEVPFMLKVRRGEALYRYVEQAVSRERYSQLNDKAVFISGVIDLVLKEGPDWVIIDYKTDRVETEAGLAQLRELYSPQIEIYSQVWEKLTGELVKEKQLYFTG